MRVASKRDLFGFIHKALHIFRNLKSWKQIWDDEFNESVVFHVFRGGQCIGPRILAAVCACKYKLVSLRKLQVFHATNSGMLMLGLKDSFSQNASHVLYGLE